MTHFDLFSPGLADITYQPASGRSYEDQEAIAAHPLTSPASEWSEPEFVVHGHDENGRHLTPTRVLVVRSGYLAFHPDDIHTVDSLLSAFGEFLPIRTTRGRFLYFRPSEYLDGLDEIESGAKYFRDRKRIIRLRQVVLHNKRILSVGVFKLARAERGPVYYRNDVANALVETGLFEGIEFQLEGWATI
ncbi:hypothetical protein [Mycobacterium camsae]|uniref:hypothetical protein n=1 Tax=Mycobacterium gordonae TaxID=1778 RepID=UPI00197D5221|nr:hypothetical protein [Mycobacterium gordonae]